MSDVSRKMGLWPAVARGLLPRAFTTVLVAAAALSCRPETQTTRYAFAAGVTQQLTCCGEQDMPDAVYALVLLGPGVSMCIRQRGHALRLRLSACSVAEGPVQVRVPRGERKLQLWTTNERGEIESEFAFRHDFEAGHIYEVFVKDLGQSVEWQLYAVSPERYERLHASAPPELRRAPRPPKPRKPLVLEPGTQQDGSMVWPGDDVLAPLQSAFLWPCPGEPKLVEQALSYSDLDPVCVQGFLELDKRMELSSVGPVFEAVTRCLEERYDAPADWALSDLIEGDACRSVLGREWRVPRDADLKRLAYEVSQSRDSTRLVALPAMLGNVAARSDDGVSASSILARNSGPSPRNRASLLCLRDLALSPLSEPRSATGCKTIAEYSTAPAPPQGDTPRRIEQAIETRYAWAADRLETRVSQWRAGTLPSDAPAVIDDLFSLPKRLEEMTQQYARTQPPFSLSHPRGSHSVARLRAVLAEFAGMVDAAAHSEDHFIACMARIRNKRACQSPVPEQWLNRLRGLRRFNP